MFVANRNGINKGLAALLFFAGVTTVSAEQFGRFFTTAKQRQHLEELRKAKPETIIEIDETEKLSLGLKTDDPDADVLIYTFTEPLDENGEWQTTYGKSFLWEPYLERLSTDGSIPVGTWVVEVVNFLLENNQ